MRQTENKNQWIERHFACCTTVGERRIQFLLLNSDLLLHGDAAGEVSGDPRRAGNAGGVLSDCDVAICDFFAKLSLATLPQPGSHCDGSCKQFSNKLTYEIKF
jgi:hypothetical protein